MDRYRQDVPRCHHFRHVRPSPLVLEKTGAESRPMGPAILRILYDRLLTFAEDERSIPPRLSARSRRTRADVATGVSHWRTKAQLSISN